MKKYLLALCILGLLAACAPQARPTEQSLLPNDDSYANPGSYTNPGSYPDDSYPNGNSSAPNAPADLTPAQQAAQTALSQSLSLSPGQFTLLSTEAVDWRDGCLGIQRVGVMCTQAVVPGYRITFDVSGALYEVRTNTSGSLAIVVQAPPLGSTVEEDLLQRLANNLGLKLKDVQVVSSSDVEFGDACLGVALLNVECTQVVTPGRIIVLEANGVQYAYHTTADGSFIQPASLLLTWRREGGIAGFCDSLTVYLSGEIVGRQCKSQPDQAAGTFATTLTPEERAQLTAWLQELGQLNIDSSDPEGVADRMVVTLEFYGSGQGTLPQTDQPALLDWAQSIFQRLYN